MENIVRTIYGSYLQTCLITDNDPVIKPNSTLNEKFNIGSDYTLQPGERPTINTICIGNGGHRTLISSDGIPKIDPVQHTARDAALYNHLPFVVRPLSNDLDSTQRTKYRLRVVTDINNTPYVLYYLRVLDYTITTPEMEYIEIIDGVKYTQPFEPTLDDLSPTPPPLTNTGTNVLTNEYLATTAKVPVIFTAEDIAEIVNACDILYGDPNLAIISEIGFCSGLDRPIVGEFVNGPSSYIESVVTQVNSIVNVFYALNFTSDKIEFVADFGSVEPLLSLTNVP